MSYPLIMNQYVQNTLDNARLDAIKRGRREHTPEFPGDLPKVDEDLQLINALLKANLLSTVAEAGDTFQVTPHGTNHIPADGTYLFEPNKDALKKDKSAEKTGGDDDGHAQKTARATEAYEKGLNLENAVFAAIDRGEIQAVEDEHSPVGFTLSAKDAPAPKNKSISKNDLPWAFGPNSFVTGTAS